MKGIKIMNEILNCKLCGCPGELRTMEIQEDDEGKYTYEMYIIECSNEECINYDLSNYDKEWTEDRAIEAWNEIQKRD